MPSWRARRRSREAAAYRALVPLLDYFGEVTIGGMLSLLLLTQSQDLRMGITIVVVMRIHIGMVMARMRYISLCRALLLMLSSTWHLLALIMFDEDRRTR